MVQHATVKVQLCLTCPSTGKKALSSPISPVETPNRAELAESNLHTIVWLVLAENPGLCVIPVMHQVGCRVALRALVNPLAESRITKTQSC